MENFLSRLSIQPVVDNGFEAMLPLRIDTARFYVGHGFVLEGEEGVDLHYRWRAREAVS